MKIVTTSAHVAANDISDAVRILRGPQRDALESDECLSYEIFVDPDQHGNIFIIHIWESETAFDDYRTSDQFAQMGLLLKPMMTKPPETVIYEVALNP